MPKHKRAMQKNRNMFYAIKLHKMNAFIRVKKAVYLFSLIKLQNDLIRT